MIKNKNNIMNRNRIIFTVVLLLMLGATTMYAQVAYLQRVSDVASYPSEEGEQPELESYNWFKATYADQGKGAIVSLSEVLSISPANYPVLWVNVDAVGLADLAATGIDATVINAIGNYVKAGGNLLLTKQASRIATEIGRMGVKDNGVKYYPGWGNGGYNVGGDTWSVNAQIGVDFTLRDAREHPVFDGITGEVINDYAYETFPLVGAVKRTDNNNMWIELDRKTGEGRVGNDRLEQLNLFESDWGCTVLAVWGGVRDYCAPTIIEFHPQGDYKGSIIAIGAAAYQWGRSNDRIGNVKKLTENVLGYLNHTGVEYGYMLPYTFTEIYSVDEYKAEYQSAQWFYDRYVTSNRGRFVHQGEAIPSGMKVLWIHNDRIGQSKEAFYNAVGGDSRTSELQAFVSGGGKLYLSKQACYLAYKMGKIYEPGWGNGGYVDGSDVWSINAGALGNALDASSHKNRSAHPVYQYMTAGSYPNLPYETYQLIGATRRTDNNNLWAEMDYDRSGHRLPNNDIGKLAGFEDAWHCHVLAVWGHVQDFCGAGMIEFLPTANEGTIIANGFAAYQWGTNNSEPLAISNTQDLTKGILDYLYHSDSYTRSVTNGKYGTICLPRASSAVSGADFFRVAGKEMDGSTPMSIVLEQVDVLEAGVPYVFQAKASAITITYTGGATVSPENSSSNGLIGSYDLADIADDTNHYILNDNTLYQVNASKVGANRAYFDLSAMDEYTEGSSPAPRRRMSIHQVPTATDQAVTESDGCRKLVEEGVLYIIRDGVKYSAQGQMVR